MKIILKRDYRRFKYEQVFGDVTPQFSDTLLVDNGSLDIEPNGSVACTCFTVDKVKSGDTGKSYDHTWLWTKMVQAGKVSSGGASPQDAFSQAVKGQKVVGTGEIDTSVAYVQVDGDKGNYFLKVKSAIQNEFNKGFKRPVGVGTFWFAEWSAVLPNGTLPHGTTHVSDHEWLICGWDKEHPNSFKIDTHEGYYKYITQEEFNYAMDITYGSVALTLVQTTDEQIEFLKNQKIDLIKTALDFCFNLYKILTARLALLKITPLPKPAGIPPFPSKIVALCAAVAIYEGGKPTRHNPGNIRCGVDKTNWNHLAIGADNGFCVFKDDATGSHALQEKFYNICTGKSATYNAEAKRLFGLLSCSELTIEQTFQIYAPSNDANDPFKYAKFISSRIGLSELTKMKELL